MKSAKPHLPAAQPPSNRPVPAPPTSAGSQIPEATKASAQILINGDCLEIARHQAPRGAFRLIYLDPPFLTGRTRLSPSGIHSYPDAWPNHLADYLPWLRERLEAMHPLLLPNGSLVLHLDYRTTHYARIMLDEIFGYDRFVNEIIWHYTGGGRSKSRFSCKHDSLLWYSRGTSPNFNIDAVRVPYKPTSGYARGGIVSAAGKKYHPNPRGTPVDDVWDIPIVNPLAAERVDYPTQKPLALLERLIAALSGPGDLIGDFFCGSGTTLVAAARLGRRWFGTDCSPAAIACSRQRLAAVSPEPKRG